ncbi:MAG: T9SS type A sorting domain-containing protein [Ignavibacteria bacterium]|nr:T9SS type A sorting domain-containing protein [Ignavibacteria bacterium]
MHKVAPGGTLCGQWDGESGGDIAATDFCFGTGSYKFCFWWRDAAPYVPDTNQAPNDEITVHLDASGMFNAQDLGFLFNDAAPRLYYTWKNNGVSCDNEPFPSSRVLKSWEACPDPASHLPKDYEGGFKYDRGTLSGTYPTPNPYTIIPIDPRQYCTSDYLPGSPTQNHYFNELYNTIGFLTLNLIIEKNDVNGNPVEITTPTAAPFLTNYPPPIAITEGTALRIAKGSNNQERLLRFKKYSSGDYGTFLSIKPDAFLDLQASSNANERAHILFESYCNSEVWESGLVLMRTNSKMTLQGNSFFRFNSDSKLTQHPGSIIEVHDDATLLNCGADFYVNAPTVHLFDNGRYIVSNACPEDFISSYESIADSGGAIILSDSTSIEIADDCKITFDGSDSYMKVEPGTTVRFGQGASIEFKNGAYLDANGCTFTSLNIGDIWSGIKLDGAGSQSVIQNCTISNAANSIEVFNTVCSIVNNTISVPASQFGACGIKATNESNIMIQSNIINLGSNTTATGISFLNYDSEGDGEIAGSSAYALYIINNSINGGLYPISIGCLSANQLPFFIKGNVISPLSGISSYGIFAYNISGYVKNNTFANSLSSNALTLQQSNMNVFSNLLNSADGSLLLQTSSMVQMAPIETSSGQLLWMGGHNNVNSEISNCVGFDLDALPIISPYGRNCFTLGSQNSNPHILGELCTRDNIYNAIDNFWSPSVSSQSFDISCYGSGVDVLFDPYYNDCPEDIGEIIGNELHNLGNGLYDTIFITSAGGGMGGGSNETQSLKSISANTKNSFIASDKTLFYEAIMKRNQKDFAGAILKCKQLINDHDSSNYFLMSLSELYLNYLESDTIENQNITSGLFNNLKTYLEQKINQYQLNSQLVDKAYKYVLMCIVKTVNYTDAIAGYENIMNNHPDPIARLNASWDRSAVVLTMGQGGGLGKGNSVWQNEKKLKRLLDKNPVHKIVKDVFKRSNEDNFENSKNVKYSNDEKIELKRRIEKFNPSNYLELQNKLSTDLKFLNVLNSNKISGKPFNGVTPKKYNLYQNYPNPFNPVTSIKYDIPKDNFVNIRIYDLLGREVFSSGEFKKAGSYEVKFDGTNFASGMYFYSLESGSFRETKKMVLIK